jgi:hypothetical protein
MPFQIALVTYKNMFPPRFEIRVSFLNGYISPKFEREKHAELVFLVIFILQKKTDCHRRI